MPGEVIKNVILFLLCVFLHKPLFETFAFIGFLFFGFPENPVALTLLYLDAALATMYTLLRFVGFMDRMAK